MTQQQLLLQETVDNVFGEVVTKMTCKKAPLDFESAWLALQDLGIDSLFLSEEEGGFAGSWKDARIIFYLSGRHGLALPICETIIAKKILQDAKMPIPKGPLTIGLSSADALVSVTNGSGETTFTGLVPAAPWGGMANAVLTSCRNETGDLLVLLESGNAKPICAHENEAGEPRDDMEYRNSPVLGSTASINPKEELLRLGALMRASQMSGALDSALELSVSHVKSREQFGRPLAKFQAIQQQLAILAEECGAVSCAAHAAAEAEDLGDSAFEVAATKLRSNRSVEVATSIAHQVHGAIGFTKEYNLHYFTQRLWSWRSEFGNERYWSMNLGQQVLAVKDQGFWRHMTMRSDRNTP